MPFGGVSNPHAPYEVVGTGGTGAAAGAIQVTPEKFGAKRNGKVVYDGAIAAGSKIVHSATAHFSNATLDVGKYLVINSAGAAALEEEKAVAEAKRQHNSLCARIVAVLSETEVEVDTAATTEVNNAFCLYATDDTQAFISAIASGVLQAQGSSAYVEVVCSMGIYGVAGELLKTQKGWAQIPLPLIECTKGGGTAQGPKVTVKFKGTSDNTALPLWFQKVPQQQGAVMFSFGPRKPGELGLESSTGQPAYSAAFGCPAMVGGPSAEQGFTSEEYSNMHVVVEGVTTSHPCNSTITPWELEGIASAALPYNMNSALGIPGFIGEGNKYLEKYPENINEFVKPWAGFEGGFLVKLKPACAVRMPARGNNDNSLVGNHTCEGHTCGIVVGEHGFHGRMSIVYGVIGITFAKIGPSLHTTLIGYASVEGCTFGVYGSAAGETNLEIQQLDTEGAGGRWSRIADIYDPLNHLTGRITTFVTAKPIKLTGGKFIKVIDMTRAPGALATNGYVTPVVGATTEAITDEFFRDAQITITAPAANAVTAIAIDGVSKPLEIAATKSLTITKPSGKSIALTYAGAEKPTWTWELF